MREKFSHDNYKFNKMKSTIIIMIIQSNKNLGYCVLLILFSNIYFFDRLDRKSPPIV